MKTSGFDLTVGIPTYNRGKQLLESLIQICQEAQRYDKKIEILISDNASSDNTYSIVKKIQAEYDLVINYYKNDDNYGFDYNVDNVIKKAQSNFVLVMSDDDILMKDSLSHYFSCIQHDPAINLAIGKAYFMDHNLQSEIIGFSDHAFDHFSDDKIYYFANGNALLGFTEKLFCGISGVMFNKMEYIKENMDEFMQSQFIHTAAIFKMLSKNDSTVAIINIPVLVYRLGDKNTKIKSPEEIVKVGFGLLNLLIKIKPLYGSTIWYGLYGKELTWVRRTLLGIKSREGLSQDIIQRYKELLDNERNYKFLDTLIAKLPDNVFKPVYWFYRLIRYKKNGY